MLKLAALFAVIALIAAILGFGGLAGAFADIAIFLFVAALVIFGIFLVLGIMGARKISGR